MFRSIIAHKKLRAFVLLVFFAFTFMTALTAPPHRQAQACTCWLNPGCNFLECIIAKIIIEILHDFGEDIARRSIRGPFHRYRKWLTEKFFIKFFIRELMGMSEQMSTVALKQAYIMGTFFDAKHQLETERLFLELQNEAHRDYQPSTDFCWFGTNVRSLSDSEQKGRFVAEALSERQIKRHLGSMSMAGSVARDQDREARWRQFTRDYCDTADNSGGGLGLVAVCLGGGSRVNKDIDFTQTIDYPRTLDVNLTGLRLLPTPDTEDVMAISSNLYGHNAMTHNLTPEMLRNDEYRHLYMRLRSLMAQRSIAENSFNAIVGMKSSGTTDVGQNGEQTRNFLGAVLTELGVPADDVYKMIGENPSYYAQLEILAKKIYQNPDFYADLYDKPANVARKKAAIKAVGLILDRALYESELRQEMMTSVLLSAKLRKRFRDIETDLSNTGG